MLSRLRPRPGARSICSRICYTPALYSQLAQPVHPRAVGSSSARPLCDQAGIAPSLQPEPAGNEPGSNSEPDPRPVPGASGTEFSVLEEATTDLEVKDPDLIFGMVWNSLQSKYGDDLVFPADVVLLCGAPGSGKGTMAEFIQAERGFTAHPITTSSLLNTPKFQEIKNAGRLVADKDVIEAVFEELLDKKYQHGALLDGFPRTAVQADCIRLLYEKIKELRYQARDDPARRDLFPRPVFHICVLYCDETTSIQRQLARGAKQEKFNQIAHDIGLGTAEAARATDVNESHAKRRYQLFKDEMFHALQKIKDTFHFHFIDASGSPESVKEAIQREFAYQSSMELSDAALDMVRAVMPADQVIRHARQKMVQRLNAYARDHTDLLHQVIELISTDFTPLLMRQALAGEAFIRSNSPLLENGLAINMALDLLAERGFTVVLSVHRERIAHRVEPAVPSQAAKVHNRVLKTFEFRVTFPRPRIRRAED